MSYPINYGRKAIMEKINTSIKVLEINVSNLTNVVNAVLEQLDMLRTQLHDLKSEVSRNATHCDNELYRKALELEDQIKRVENDIPRSY